MTVQDFLSQATKTLQKAGIESARLDTLILLEDILGIDRSHILAHPDLALTHSQITTLNKYITQRKQHTPLAYIRGEAAFFGRAFTVNPHTLVPRPETESIIELARAIAFSEPAVIADVGTGTGCIGVTAALEIPDSTVHFYDIDSEALAVAKSNAQRHAVRGQYYQGNVLDSWRDDYTVVLANLPYVPHEYPINKAADFEPRLALFSGVDGLDHYRLLWQQIAAQTKRPQHVIIEALPLQHAALNDLAVAAGYKLHTTLGYVQHFTLT